MPEKISFKERVRSEIIKCAKAYKRDFVDYEYLVCSDAFVSKAFYIIDAKEVNFQHLTGVNSLISPQEFFEKSYNGTLQESDFDFIKDKQDEKSVKGSVRRKIKVLPNIGNIFCSNTKVEENMIKNQIKCSFAATDNSFTLGFIDATKSRPMSLIQGNGLDNSKAKFVNLILRKHISKEKFDEIVVGDYEMIHNYINLIEPYLDGSIINQYIELIENLNRQQMETKLQIASTGRNHTDDL